MARLGPEFLERCEAVSHRMVDVAEAIEQRRMARRICDQIVGCGTSVGANMHEADAAMTRKDFVKSLAISAKELSESRFWLRFVGKREWIAMGRSGASACRSRGTAKDPQHHDHANSGRRQQTVNGTVKDRRLLRI